ncbi:MAG: iron-sulfur cluster assembly scaffold protein [Candidatus Portnoybacteria bacterium]|nr:iron-sulfur cluster assembly scaffold protein [Candidatus Portnoybacteria bacterium]
MYSKKVLNHFNNPKFFGKMKDADLIGKAGNPRCGDLLTLYLKIDKKTNKIKDIKFETLGCAAAIAASDMICELAKGKTLEEARNITFRDVSNSLGKLPPLKMHCAQLVTEALNDAIKKYKK